MITLIAMVALLVLGTALAGSGVTDVVHARRQESKTAAYYLARSGAQAVASYLINNPEELPDIIDREPDEGTGYLDGGKFEVAVTDEGGLIRIESTGYSGNFSETVVLTLVPGGGAPLLDTAVFALEGFELTGSSKIIGNCGTNSVLSKSVVFGSSADVEGNLNIGPGGDRHTVIQGPRGLDHVSGNVDWLDEIREYPLPPFPEFPENLPNEGNFYALWNPSPPYYISQDGQYNELTVKSELIIDIPDNGVRRIRARALEVSGSGRITLNGSGILYLYVDEVFTFQNSAKLVNNENPDPNQVMFFYSGPNKISISGDADFYGCLYAEKADLELLGSGSVIGSVISGGSSILLEGGTSADVRTIYAPKADVTLSGSAEIYGSVIGKSVEVLGNSRVFYAQFPWGIIPLPESGSSGLQIGQWNKK